jgi:hypothetical protein
MEKALSLFASKFLTANYTKYANPETWQEFPKSGRASILFG